MTGISFWSTKSAALSYELRLHRSQRGARHLQADRFGTEKRSIFREPHTWSVLEMFKIKNGMITGVEATFIGAPYYIRSPWTRHPDPR